MTSRMVADVVLVEGDDGYRKKRMEMQKRRRGTLQKQRVVEKKKAKLSRQGFFRTGTREREVVAVWRWPNGGGQLVGGGNLADRGCLPELGFVDFEACLDRGKRVLRCPLLAPAWRGHWAGQQDSRTTGLFYWLSPAIASSPLTAPAKQTTSPVACSVKRANCSVYYSSVGLASGNHTEPVRNSPDIGVLFIQLCLNDGDQEMLQVTD